MKAQKRVKPIFKPAVVEYPNDIPTGTFDGSNTLLPITQAWQGCRKCEIGGLAFNHVFLDTQPSGINPSDIQILFVGEAPGRSEDVLGRPFVGPAGRLLRSAIAIVDPSPTDRVNVGFANLLVCRPVDHLGGDDREPREDEISNCHPRLIQMLRVIRPTVIAPLGKVATTRIRTTLRSEFLECCGRVMGNYHPSYILRVGGLETRAGRLFLSNMKEAFDYARLHPKGQPARPEHTCHAQGCSQEVPPRLLMCLRHWRMVPQRLQRDVLQHYRKGQEIDKSPTREYLSAARQAINSVARREEQPTIKSGLKAKMVDSNAVDHRWFTEEE